MICLHVSCGQDTLVKGGSDQCTGRLGSRQSVQISPVPNASASKKIQLGKLAPQGNQQIQGWAAACAHPDQVKQDELVKAGLRRK